MWYSPLNLTLIPTDDPMSFQSMSLFETGIPFGNHPGAFGFKRKYHTHEGVDLYCKEDEVVWPVECGVVTAIAPFTGEIADPPSPWWHNTYSVMVEGESGAVLYGEIIPAADIKVGKILTSRTVVGTVTQVLKKDKGRPMTMLHLELHKPGTTIAKEWVDTRPESLLDPTKHLLSIVR